MLYMLEVEGPRKLSMDSGGRNINIINGSNTRASMWSVSVFDKTHPTP